MRAQSWAEGAPGGVAIGLLAGLKHWFVATLASGCMRAATVGGGRARHFYLNSLDGTIPTEMSLLAGLTLIELNQNELNGTIPSLMGLLTGLTYMCVATLASGCMRAAIVGGGSA
ncbi:hypothetical protein T492DRAFT_865220 [Pavlovales sp. CCMP2436]|nr:hypothetical protein T492DRAFT_865220 [Pavlovales sp. CCMP2436]